MRIIVPGKILHYVKIAQSENPQKNCHTNIVWSMQKKLSCIQNQIIARIAVWEYSLCKDLLHVMNGSYIQSYICHWNNFECMNVAVISYNNSFGMIEPKEQAWLVYTLRTESCISQHWDKVLYLNQFNLMGENQRLLQRTHDFQFEIIL